MKLLLLLFLVGCATASVYHDIAVAAEDVYQEFLLGLEQSGSFSEGLGYEHPVLKKAEDDVKTELGKRLRETLNEILEKMRDSLDKGEAVKDDLQQKLKEVKDKLKDLKIDMGNKAKELMDKIKDKAKKFWEELIEKLKGDKRRSIQDPQAAFDLKEIFGKLKNLLRDKIDKEELKAKVEKLFGKGSQIADSLLEVINEKGANYKQKLLDLVDRYLGKEERETRSIQEVWDKVRDYFKNLQIDLKEKYLKFGEWVKKNFEQGMEKGKTKMENIKKIAEEFVTHTKGVSKDVAVEALEFLKPYKEDLGSLWDQVKDTVKNIVSKED